MILLAIALQREGILSRQVTTKGSSLWKTPSCRASISPKVQRFPA